MSENKIKPWPLSPPQSLDAWQSVRGGNVKTFLHIRIKFSSPDVLWFVDEQATTNLMNQWRYVNDLRTSTILIHHHEHALPCGFLTSNYLWNDDSQVWRGFNSLALSQVGLSLWQCPHQGANIITMWSPLQQVGQCQNFCKILCFYDFHAHPWHFGLTLRHDSWMTYRWERSTSPPVRE